MLMRVSAECGLPAGCMLNEIMVKLYCLDAFRKVAEFNRGVDFDFFVDDLAFSCVGHPVQVAMRLERAAINLKAAVKNELHCDIALDKVGVTATSVQSTRMLELLLGQLGTNYERVAPTSLGVTFNPGCRRDAQGKGCKRHKRLVEGMKRLKRIRWIHSRLPRKKGRMQRIVRQGLLPAMTYGSRVTGSSDREMNLLCSHCGACTTVACMTADLVDGQILVPRGVAWMPAVAIVLACGGRVLEGSARRQTPLPQLR